MKRLGLIPHILAGLPPGRFTAGGDACHCTTAMADMGVGRHTNIRTVLACHRKGPRTGPKGPQWPSTTDSSDDPEASFWYNEVGDGR